MVVRDTLHGVVIPDPYRWLEDQNSSETRKWIDAQNTFTNSLLDNLPARAPLTKRLEELSRVEELGVPTERAGVYFYTKKSPANEQSVLYARAGLHGAEQVFLDPNPLSRDHSISAGYEAFSNDGTLVAYYLRAGGEDEIALRLRNMKTVRELPDSLPRSNVEAVAFDGHNEGYYYTLLRPLMGRKILYHRLGTPVNQDSVIFGEGYGADVMFDPTVSANGRYLLVTVAHGWSSSDLLVQDLSGYGRLRPIVKDINANFSGIFDGDRLFIVTNWNAPHWRILEARPTSAVPEEWKQVVPEQDDPIDDYSLLGGKLFVQYLHNVKSRISIFDLDGHPAGEIALPGMGLATVPNGRWGTTEGFYSFSSFTSPRAIYRYDVAAAKSTLWSQPKIPFASDRFETEQVWYRSKDGTNVPMFLVHLRGMKMDGERPTLLAGYGGFNYSMLPDFSNLAAVWVELGGVYALPNLRGGSEFGEAWHKAGMGPNKQNVFDDFIAAAEWLIHNNVTGPSKLAIEGASNGGLLVGAAMTQRPDLFKAVVCKFPLLDMLRYHKFLQGPQWTSEYGSADSLSQFRTLLAYSPYHHVRAGVRYPATLFVTGDADTRVAPLHARKMTALLQSVVGSEVPILLHYETEGGHSRGESTTQEVRNRAIELSFLTWQLGVKVRNQ